MTELKDILPKHFEMIGFDYKKFVTLIEGLCEFDENISFDLRYISYRDACWELCTIDYATILTSKEYIDTVVNYIKNNSEKRENDFNQKYYVFWNYTFFQLSEIEKDIKEDIIDWLYDWTIVEFINNITKDE